MTVLRAHELQRHETPGGNVTTPLATPSRGASDVRIIRQQQAPGGANPLHRHDREEIVLMSAGTVTITLDDERVEAGAGDTVIVPSGVLHRIENAGAEPAEWLLELAADARFFGADGTEMRPAWAM